MTTSKITLEIASEVLPLTIEAIIIGNIYRLTDTGLNSDGEPTGVFPWSGELFKCAGQLTNCKNFIFTRRVAQSYTIIFYRPHIGFITNQQFPHDTNYGHVIKVTTCDISKSDIENFISSEKNVKFCDKIIKRIRLT